MVEKPGDASHTPRWDHCVEQVGIKGSGANAYAVCTAMLGDESFKSMSDEDFSKEVDSYMQKLGIAAAGPVPNSLLARQDLAEEGIWDGLDTSKSFKGTWASLGKGPVEQTGKQLKEAANEAEDVTTKKEVIELADRIKNIQIKRQKATLAAREKSFKDFYKSITS